MANSRRRNVGNKNKASTNKNSVTVSDEVETVLRNTEVTDSGNIKFGNTTNQNTNTNERGTKKMAGLTADQIQTLLGKTRQKGIYQEKIKLFLASGEQGVCVNDEWVELSEKKATTLKQGFENAKDSKDAPEGSEYVKVISNEDKVYLINLAAAGLTDEAVDGTAVEPEPVEA